MINRFDRDGTRHFNGALVLHDDVLNLENENKMLREALESIVEFFNTESNSTEEMVAHAWTTTRKALK